MRWSFAIFIAGCGFSLQPVTVGTDGDTSVDGSSADGALDSDPGLPIDAAIDAAIDAPPDAPPDALPVFDPASCPAGYSVMLAGSPLSRYRFITSNQPWLTHHQDCANDLAGATHLAVIDTVVEAQQLNAATSSVSYHVGATQAPNQATVQAGWLTLTGEAVPVATWHPGQPNDDDDVENNAQNRAAVNTSASSLVQDIDAAFSTHAVCECDGKPVAAAVSAIL